MALLWIEGYEGYGTTTGTNINTYMGRRYATHDYSSHWYIQPGRYGGYAGLGNGNYYAGTPALTTCDTVVFGCALYQFSNSMSSNQYFMALMDNTTMGVNCKLNIYCGEIDVYRGTTFLGRTSGANILNQWNYIEIKVKCHDTEGTVEIRVNGVIRLSLTNQDTKAGTNACHNILRIYLATIFYLDDIYFLDATGDINSDFLGPQRVVGIFPSADTGTEEWTPSTGTSHYVLVDETRDNDDTDYVESATADQIDLWDYDDVSAFDTIAGVQINTTAKRTDATAFDVITRVHSGSTDSDNSGQTTTTSYVAYVRVVETDPNTGSAWTETNVNAAQFGVKVA